MEQQKSLYIPQHVRSHSCQGSRFAITVKAEMASGSPPGCFPPLPPAPDTATTSP